MGELQLGAATRKLRFLSSPKASPCRLWWGLWFETVGLRLVACKIKGFGWFWGLATSHVRLGFGGFWALSSDSQPKTLNTTESMHGSHDSFKDLKGQGRRVDKQERS